ncbi:MAG: hypothetical protein V2A54_10510 [Bacteroidota bacterium]
MKSVKPLLFFSVVFIALTLLSACDFLKQKNGSTVSYTVQYSVYELLYEKSVYFGDSLFLATLDSAERMQKREPGRFLVHFRKAWDSIMPQRKMADVFSRCFPGKISRGFSNKDVLKTLKKEKDDAVDQIVKIIKNRLAELDLEDLNVLRYADKDWITFEVKNVENSELVKKTIVPRGELVFWRTYEFADLWDKIENANTRLASCLKDGQLENIREYLSIRQDFAKYAKDNPLFALLQPSLLQDEKGNYRCNKGPVVGFVVESDRDKVMQMLKVPSVKAMLPRDLFFCWSDKPQENSGFFYELVALRKELYGLPLLTGDAITQADQTTNGDGQTEIVIEMNEEGSKRWERITKDNIGKSIALVIDGKVLVYPVVNDIIESGRSSITGNLNEEEAQSLSIVLKNGKLPMSLIHMHSVENISIKK